MYPQDVFCLDWRPRGRGFVASPASLSCGPLARHINPSLVLVQPRKTRPCLTERLLMGRKGSNQTNSQTNSNVYKQAPRSKEQSHRDNFLVYPQDVFCLVEQLFTTAVATKTAYVGLRYVYSNI